MNFENSADAFGQLTKLADSEDVSSEQLGQLVLLILKALHTAYPETTSLAGVKGPPDLMGQILRWLRSLHLAAEFEDKHALTLSGFRILTKAARANPMLETYLADTSKAPASEPTQLILQVLRAHYELTRKR